MNKGKIIKGIGGLYYIAAYGSIYECSARGRFRKAKITPTVGDYVEFTILDEQNKKGALDKILPRINFLIRPRVANIDTAIITFAAAAPNINMDLLDRFLLLAEYQNIPKIIICINKCDLVNENDKENIKNIYKNIYKIIFTSALNNIGIDQLKEEIKGGIAVFAGPSGVGKSSLINSLIPESNRQTGEISKKIERGKHTTRQVELIEAYDNTYIVDSPGFTSLNLDFMKTDELPHYFIEFEPFLGKCYYNDCRHINEPDCAVKEEVGKSIAKCRYERYTILYNEFKQRR